MNTLSSRSFNPVSVYKHKACPQACMCQAFGQPLTWIWRHCCAALSCSRSVTQCNNLVQWRLWGHTGNHPEDAPLLPVRKVGAIPLPHSRLEQISYPSLFCYAISIVQVSTFKTSTQKCTSMQIFFSLCNALGHAGGTTDDQVRLDKLGRFAHDFRKQKRSKSKESECSRGAIINLDECFE